MAQKADSTPTVAISPAPTAGPTRKASPHTASWIPLTRSRRIPVACETPVSIDSRAVTPAGSNTAPRTARMSTQVKVRPVVSATMGIAATATADIRSLKTEVRRRPSVSTIVPEKSEAKSVGTPLMSATSPLRRRVR